MLYGDLGRKFGKVHRYAAKTASECVKAMCVTLPGFREYFAPNYYRVLRAGKEVLDVDGACTPQSNKESIRIIPVVTGAGGNGLFGIILGAVLIFAPYMAPAFFAGMAPAIASGIASIGWSLLIGGVSQLLFAPDKPQSAGNYEAANNQPNYSFSGAVNTVAQGNPVPICYGRLIVGSQVISAGLTSQEN